MRWVNYHLAQSSCSRRLRNFGSDVADSEIYAHLLQQIDPDRRVSAADVMRLCDKTARAQQVVSTGRRLGSDFSIRPKDIVSANEKLNLAFVAGLFNACPALEPLDEEELKLFDECVTLAIHARAQTTTDTRTDRHTPTLGPAPALTSPPHSTLQARRRRRRRLARGARLPPVDQLAGHRRRVRGQPVRRRPRRARAALGDGPRAAWHRRVVQGEGLPALSTRGAVSIPVHLPSRDR